MLVRRSLFSCVFGLLSLAALASDVFAAPQWVQQAVPGPSPRTEFGFAYDSGRGVSVLFGGSSNLTFTAVNRETWEWDGVQWSLRSTTGPTARCDNAFAYDSNRHRVVSFGGYNGGYMSDTWEWDGTNWTQIAVAGPSARADAFMAFDSIRNVMVLFGGLAPSGQVLNDTWVYNGTTWTRPVVAVPTRRWIQRMAFDRDRGKVVLFGGASTAGVLGDTWEWDGTQWTQVAISGPAARYADALCYDTDRHLTLLFGGQTGFDFGDGPLGDTWEYDGTAWSERAIPGPSARTFVKMVYDTMRQRAVLFGGFDGTNVLGDTWELVNDNPTPAAISLASAEAREGSVTITWQAGGTTPIEGTVLRRRIDTEWAPIGTARSDGSGRLRFEDLGVAAGRYGYQLEL